MTRDALVIYRKEMKNLLKDRRTLVMLLVLPLATMPLIFGTLGTVTRGQQREAAETVYPVWIQGNDDPRFRSLLEDSLKTSTARAGGEGALSVAFPDGYRPGVAAEVKLFFDSTSTKSGYAANRIQAALMAYTDALAEDRLRERGLAFSDLRTISVVRVDTAPKAAQGAGILPSLLPYLILIYIFAGSMNIGLDATAGEKERGSLASILVNQVSRTSIAVGKIMYVATAALMNAVASFAGIIIAFRIGGPAAPGALSASLAVFSAAGVLGLLITLLALSALAASVIVLLGCYSKTMREGGAYVLPVYLVVLVVGVASSQMDPSRNLALFLVPLVNSVFVLKEILLAQPNLSHLAVSVGINVIAAAVLVRLIAGLYNGERILDTV
jgi:sodium transport system permease protein